MNRLDSLRRVMRALRVELLKAAHTKTAVVGPLLLILVVLSLPRVHGLEADGRSDYGFIAYATQLALNLVGLFLVLMFTASLIASETGSGSVRTVLVRPIRRGEFMAAKFLTGAAYAAAILAAAALPAWILAAAFGDLSGVSYGGEMLHTNLEMLQAYALGALAALLPLLAAVAYGLMMSTIAAGAGRAMAAAVGIWLVVDAIKYPLGIDAFLFTSYMEAPWRVFSDRADGLAAEWWNSLRWCAATSVAWTIAFLGVSHAVFVRRDLRL
jgi:ABC-2 type transport system permease protein